MDRKTEQNLLKSTSIIHTEDESGTREQASCFFIQRTVGGKVHHYLVTNGHVLKNKTKLYIYLTQYNQDTGIRKYNAKITLSPNHAVKYHPTHDLALLNIDSVQNLKTGNCIYEYNPISIDRIPKDFYVFSALQQILMLGYPSGIHDGTTDLPVARSGITSTPVFSNYKGKAHFLIDIPFLNGCSGSPIFAEWNGEVYLIGVEYSKLLEKITVDRERNRLYRSSKYTKEIETGLGIAIRSDQIFDFF